MPFLIRGRDESGKGRRALTDKSLVERAQRGDSEAFNELADRYSTRLRRVLYRITGNCERVKEAVQEALMRAWLNIGRFEGRSRFSTWLTRSPAIVPELGYKELEIQDGSSASLAYLEMIDLLRDHMADEEDR